MKSPMGINVLEAAHRRIEYVFDNFPKVCVSFSAGKDSTVMTHLVAREARLRKRRIGLLLIDLEAQYNLTISHAEKIFAEYADTVDPYWVALPLKLRNAVSVFQPRWVCWDPAEQSKWIRTPPSLAITDPARFPFFRRGMEFEEFVDDFGSWYSGNTLTAFLIGIRADESLNRYRAIAGDKQRHGDACFTTWKSGTAYNAYPIYDWRTADIWRFHAAFPECSYNPLYDLMHQAGLSIHEQRICQPYGDDQRKGLWLYQVIEPETWGKVVARVNGANFGSLYAQESGNVLGRIKITKPDGHTWKSFANLLLESLPPHMQTHYSDKILLFTRWWEQRGYPNGIPDEADPAEEASRKSPSWRRVCKALLRNDYWCKGLSFSQQKSGYYEKYRKVMRNRRKMWGIQW